MSYINAFTYFVIGVTTYVWWHYYNNIIDYISSVEKLVKEIINSIDILNANFSKKNYETDIEIVNENNELLEKYVILQMQQLEEHSMQINSIQCILTDQLQVNNTLHEKIKDIQVRLDSYMSISIFVGNVNQQNIYSNIQQTTSINYIYDLVHKEPFEFHLHSLQSFINIKQIDLALLYIMCSSMIGEPNNEIVEACKREPYILFNPYNSLYKSNVTMDMLLEEPRCKRMIHYIQNIRPDIEFTWSGMLL